MKFSLSKTLLSGLVLAGMAGCQHGSEDQDRLGGAQNAVRGNAVEVPLVKEITDDDLKVRQVQASQTEETRPWNKVLEIEQLGAEDAAIAAGFSFETIEGDHPCTGALQGTERCEVISRALAKAAEANADNPASPEAELQTLTNRIIDPDTFDPVKTIDEIGRGNQLNSLAAQSVGSAFLAAPIRPDPVPEEDANPTGIEDLPPVVLDITVTQGAPGGS